MRFVLLFLFLAFITPAQAGYNAPPPTTPSLLDYPLPAPHEERPTCGLSAGGLSNAARVGEYASLLAQKWPKVTKARTCEFDGESIRVAPTPTGFMTWVDEASVLTYSSVKEVSSLVMPGALTWSPPVCPPSTIEAIMAEQLRRVFACFPEEGHSVTTRAQDEAQRKADEAALLEQAERER